MVRINLDLSEETSARLNHIRKIIDAASKTETIRRSLELTELILKIKNSEGRIFIEDQEGKKHELHIF